MGKRTVGDKKVQCCSIPRFKERIVHLEFLAMYRLSVASVPLSHRLLYLMRAISVSGGSVVATASLTYLTCEFNIGGMDSIYISAAVLGRFVRNHGIRIVQGLQHPLLTVQHSSILATRYITSRRSSASIAFSQNGARSVLGVSTFSKYFSSGLPLRASHRKAQKEPGRTGINLRPQRERSKQLN